MTFENYESLMLVSINKVLLEHSYTHLLMDHLRLLSCYNCTKPKIFASGPLQKKFADSSSKAFMPAFQELPQVAVVIIHLLLCSHSQV